VQQDAIRERVKALQGEIATLRAANREYLRRRLHTPMENFAQRQRELRLQQILDELSQLAKSKIASLD
jgi:hypothetical protein